MGIKMTTPKVAIPGLIVGILGLAAGLLSFWLERPLFAIVAGLLALASAVASMQVSKQLVQQRAVQATIEEQLESLQESTSETEKQVQVELSRLKKVADTTASEEEEALTDKETGLFSESFFHASLDSRVASARRHLRPVAIALIDVVGGLQAGKPTQADPSNVVPSIRETLRGADTACRLKNGYFATLLEDTPENGAIWTVERIRRNLSESHPELTVWAGVACYPAHAFSADEILAAAESALESAREWQQDRIEVAAAATD